MKTERLRKNEEPFNPNFKTIMTGVLPGSVGKKAAGMMMEAMLEGGAAIATENPSIQVALNRAKWTTFAKEWSETTQIERVALVTGSYGYRNHQVETLEIGTLSGSTLAIPVKLRMQMVGAKNVAEWLEKGMPELPSLLRNKREASSDSSWPYTTTWARNTDLILTTRNERQLEEAPENC